MHNKKFLTKFLFFLTLVSFAITSCNEHTKPIVYTEDDYTQFVDPFIATGANGRSSPAASYPLGLVQAGAETGNFSSEYSAGYIYGDSLINGFSQTRQSGSNKIAYGDILVQPYSGKKLTLQSKYDLMSEEATPGYYAVYLTDNNVQAEITTSAHVAFHKYLFEEEKKAHIYLDFQHGLVQNEKEMFTHILMHEVKFEDDYTISGYTEREGKAFNKYFFVIKFDKPILSKEKLPKMDEKEKASRYILSFDTKSNSTLKMKIALSTTSVNSAKRNMEKEVPHWSFDTIHEEAVAEWNKYLSRIHIEGTDQQRVKFYTSLYRLLLKLRNAADADVRDSHLHLSSHYDTLSSATYSLYTLLIPEATKKIEHLKPQLLENENRDKEIATPIIDTEAELKQFIEQHTHPIDACRVPYIYASMGRQQLSQELIRILVTEYFSAVPDAWTNDENGELSTWFVFSSLGFYPLHNEENYIIGAPQVPEAFIKLDNGDLFIMNTTNLSVYNLYVNKIELNGKIYKDRTIAYQDIAKGGNILFKMDSKPN